MAKYSFKILVVKSSIVGLLVTYRLSLNRNLLPVPCLLFTRAAAKFCCFCFCFYLFYCFSPRPTPSRGSRSDSCCSIPGSWMVTRTLSSGSLGLDWAH